VKDKQGEHIAVWFATRADVRARNAVGALQKRLAHRNPSVQLYALEVSLHSHDEIQLMSSSPTLSRKIVASPYWRSCLLDHGQERWTGL